jgi:glycosyltransferase involved in cell wall biosynthesis
MLWSILIAGIPERYHTAQPLLYSLLEKQSVARMPDVELIYSMDNKRRSVGAKRNDLLRMARGEYISFIDDDDEVSEAYVKTIHEAIVQARKSEQPIDVICFGQRATLQPMNVVHECTYSLDHWRKRKPDDRRKLEKTGQENVLKWTGPPAHTMCWRRRTLHTETDGPNSFLKLIEFEEKNFGEDVGWVDKVCEKAKNELVIVGPPLYFYKFDQNKSATR